MKVTDVNTNSNLSTDSTVVKNDEEKAKEIFKTIFLEKMFTEMFKTTKLFPGDNQTQNDFYEEQMAEALSDQFMKSSDIRWNQLFGDITQIEDTEKKE